MHEVDAHDRLGHRVLDLQARIDLEEVREVARRVDQELDRRDAAIGDDLAEARRRALEFDREGAVHDGRWRLFDDLLVLALDRAVADAERGPDPVGPDDELHLDVARRDDARLQEDAARAEAARGLVVHGLDGGAERTRLGDHADAAPTPTRRCFDHQREADAPRRLERDLERLALT